MITAGHCFKDSAGRHVSRTVAARTTATVGRADLRTRTGHVSTVVAVRQAGGSDVSLARIDPPITDIAPIHLRGKAPTVGMTLRLAGFGDTGRNKPTAKTLQTGTFEVVSRSTKVLGISGRKPRTTTSACEHDSGGPYFTVDAAGKAELVAVVSKGPSCPHVGADSAARVDAVAGWIASTVGKSHLNQPFATATPRARSSPPRASRSPVTAAAPQDPAPATPWKLALPVTASLLTGAAVIALQRRTRHRRRVVRRVRSHRG